MPQFFWTLSSKPLKSQILTFYSLSIIHLLRCGAPFCGLQSFSQSLLPTFLPSSDAIFPFSWHAVATLASFLFLDKANLRLPQGLNTHCKFFPGSHFSGSFQVSFCLILWVTSNVTCLEATSLPPYLVISLLDIF